MTKERTEEPRVGMTTWVGLLRMRLVVDLNDEDDLGALKPSSTNGMSNDDSSRVRELEDEMQQKDAMIAVKSDEIRRLSIQNKEYESRVRDSCIILLIDREARKGAWRDEEGRQGSNSSRKPTTERGEPNHPAR